MLGYTTDQARSRGGAEHHLQKPPTGITFASNPHEATYGHTLLLRLAPLAMAMLLKPTIQIYAWLPEGHRNNMIENKFGDQEQVCLGGAVL